MSERICKDCGAVDYSIAFMPTCAEKKVIDAEGVCFTCAFWRVAIAKTHDTVISGRIYSIGNVKKPPNSPHAGMAGRRFDIEYFDGRVVTTHDLWVGSEVPERYRQQVPDTARFLGGAGYVKVGDGGAWNPSRTPAAVVGDATKENIHE
jgi:hypothetical protein